MNTRPPECILAILLCCVPALAQAPFLLRDVNPTTSSTPPSGVLGIVGQSPRDGEVIVMLDDGVHGLEPWRTDGTSAGTSLLLDLTPGPAGTTLVPYQPCFSDARRLWFVVQTAAGHELWQTDGTATGTSMFLAANQITAPQVHKKLGDVAFFGVDGVLWRTDGSPSGTFSLGVPTGDVSAVRGGVAWITGWAGQISLTDGNTASVVFSSTNAQVREYPDGQVVLRIPQYGPWPNVVATTLVWLDRPGAPMLTYPYDVAIASLPGRLLLFVGAQLLTWDGVGQPALLWQYLGAYHDFEPQRVGSRCFYSAVDTVYGFELWSTDGTAAGTYPLDSGPGPAQGTLALTGYTVGDKVLLRGSLPGSNGWLFASDGTLAGTTPLVAAPPGAPTLLDSLMVPIGHRRVALAVSMAAIGHELWLADENAAALLADINPGVASSLPDFLTPTFVEQWRGIVAGASLVWAADDGVHGFEPWAFPATGVSTLLRRYGQRAFDAGDPVLGGNLTLTASRLASTDLGVVGLGLPVAVPLPLGAGQFVHLDPTTAFGAAIVIPNANGEWNANLALPSSPALVGFRAVAQPFFVSTVAPGIEVGHVFWLTLGL